MNFISIIVPEMNAVVWINESLKCRLSGIAYTHTHTADTRKVYELRGEVGIVGARDTHKQTNCKQANNQSNLQSNNDISLTDFHLENTENDENARK